jgi:hypothetical protein
MKLTYTIAGRLILVDSQDDWCASAVSNLFTGWFLRPVPNGSAPPDATLTIRFGGHPPPIPDGIFEFRVPEGGICHTDGQSFHLDFNGSRIVIGPGTERNVVVWLSQRYKLGSKILAQIISQAFVSALRRCDLYEFHCAAVVPPGQEKAILIAGSSGSGKSTLTMQLAARGWNYLSDDKLLLDSRNGLEVYALRKFFALTAETIAVLPRSRITPSSTTPGIKERVAPQDLFPASQIQLARPDAVFFTIISGKSTSEIRPLTAADAMTRLLRLCPWASYDKPTAGNHLRLLGDVARECRAFDLLAGTDLLENPGLAAELCLSSMRT